MPDCHGNDSTHHIQTLLDDIRKDGKTGSLHLRLCIIMHILSFLSVFAPVPLSAFCSSVCRSQKSPSHCKLPLSLCCFHFGLLVGGNAFFCSGTQHFLLQDQLVFLFYKTWHGGPCFSYGGICLVYHGALPFFCFDKSLQVLDLLFLDEFFIITFFLPFWEEEDSVQTGTNNSFALAL